MGEGISDTYYHIKNVNNTDVYHIMFQHQRLALDTKIERKVKIINKNGIRTVSFWLDDVLIGEKTINFGGVIYHSNGLFFGGGHVAGWQFNGVLNYIELENTGIESSTIEANYYDP